MENQIVQPKTGVSLRYRGGTLFALVAATILAAPGTAGADDDQPELWPGRNMRFEAQVAGDQVNLATNRLSIQGNHVLIDKLHAKYKCRGYQGDVKRAFVQVVAGGTRLDDRNKLLMSGGNTAHYEWHDVKLFEVNKIVAACRGRSDVQTVESVAHLKNTCGRSERHERNGHGTITLQVQCSPSQIRAAVTPIRWRYHCSGPNMYIEGTNSTSVERDTPNANINCVYRGR